MRPAWANVALLLDQSHGDATLPGPPPAPPIPAGGIPVAPPPPPTAPLLVGSGLAAAIQSATLKKVNPKVRQAIRLLNTNLCGCNVLTCTYLCVS